MNSRPVDYHQVDLPGDVDPRCFSSSFLSAESFAYFRNSLEAPFNGATLHRFLITFAIHIYYEMCSPDQASRIATPRTERPSFSAVKVCFLAYGPICSSGVVI